MHQHNDIPPLPPNQLFKPIKEEPRIQLQRIPGILLDSHRRKSRDVNLITRSPEKRSQMVKVLGHVEGAVHD